MFLGGDMIDRQRTLAIRIAAITLASDSAITLARFRPSEVPWGFGVRQRRTILTLPVVSLPVAD